MQDAVLIVASVVVGLGLVLILWRELAAPEERRRGGPVRDMFEVLLPVAATAALVVWVWIY